MLSGKRILITGGTGFIGGRLAEKLALDEGADVRVLARDFGKAIRVARLPVELVSGDVADDEAVERAVEGCDYIVHCAHDFGDQSRNVTASRSLAEAALRHGVQRMIYVSSMSVYEPLPSQGVVDEGSMTPAGNEYAEVKLAVEREMDRFYREEGLETVNIRPTIVYGPYSPPWTLQPMAQVRSRKVVLPEMGTGTCWAVYVDDVVDAMIAALVRPEAAGETFLIGGSDLVTWGEFYGAYEEAAGVDSLVLMDTSAVNQSQTATGILRRPAALLATPIAKNVYQSLRKLGGHNFWHHMRERVRPMQFPATDAQTALFASHARINLEKAERLLGYQPRFDFSTGMGITKEYIKWAQLDRGWA